MTKKDSIYEILPGKLFLFSVREVVNHAVYLLSEDSNLKFFPKT